jgi:hypothetical protein
LAADHVNRKLCNSQFRANLRDIVVFARVAGWLQNRMPVLLEFTLEFDAKGFDVGRRLGKIDANAGRRLDRRRALKHFNNIARDRIDRGEKFRTRLAVDERLVFERRTIDAAIERVADAILELRQSRNEGLAEDRKLLDLEHAQHGAAR